MSQIRSKWESAKDLCIGHARYVALSTAGMNGADLVREAGGGVVAVELEYRLGVFGTNGESLETFVA